MWHTGEQTLQSLCIGLWFLSHPRMRLHLLSDSRLNFPADMRGPQIDAIKGKGSQPLYHRRFIAHGMQYWLQLSLTTNNIPCYSTWLPSSNVCNATLIAWIHHHKN